MLTPSESDVTGDTGIGIGKQCHDDQIMEVNPLHQDPGVIGQDKILPKAGEHLAVPVALRLVDQPVAVAVFDHDVRQPDAGDEEHVLQQRHEGSHHERGEQMHVQYIPRAAQLPARSTIRDKFSEIQCDVRVDLGGV